MNHATPIALKFIGINGVLQGVGVALMMAAEKVAQRYQLALRDLTFNSKPIINNLTMLAHENIDNAGSIVQVLVNHFLAVLKSACSII